MRLLRAVALSSLFVAPVLLLAISAGPSTLRADSLAAQATDPLLELLPGEWKGEQRAGGAVLLESVRWEWVLGGKFLQCTSRATDPTSGNTTYEGIGFLRHDPRSGDYTFHWFDSEGRSEPYRGRRSGDAIEFDAQLDSSIERLIFRHDEQSYSCSASRQVAAGGEVPVFETRYRRAAGKENKKSKKEE